MLNLTCEGIEFAPSTEHNTISSCRPYIEKPGVGKWIATADGIGLTAGGRKYSWNHQNAFPLKYEPYVQDGGFPQRPQHCTQIAWLASYGAEIDRSKPWQTARFKGHYAGTEKLIPITYDFIPRPHPSGKVDIR